MKTASSELELFWHSVIDRQTDGLTDLSYLEQRSP